MKTLEDPIELYRTIKFEHIYYTSGFAISKELTQSGYDYTPPKTHACMQSGYWCNKQMREDPQSIIIYLKRCGVKNPMQVIRAIKTSKLKW